MQIDIGAFDLAVRVKAQVSWLEPTTDIAVMNLRDQFEKNLDFLCDNYQRMCSNALAAAIKKHKMYFEIPDLSLKGMTTDELDSLKEI